MHSNTSPIRESGMPDSTYWQSFFEPDLLLDEIGFQKCDKVLELGAGYGLFTLPLARHCKSLTTIEIDGDLCNNLRNILRAQHCHNVEVVEGDFTDTSLIASKGGFDCVVLFNILHMENPPLLLQNLRTMMSSRGMVYVLHWRTDIATPRGPSLAIRSTPEQCRSWFTECYFDHLKELYPASTPYHFAQVYRISESNVDSMDL